MQRVRERGAVRREDGVDRERTRVEIEGTAGGRFAEVERDLRMQDARGKVDAGLPVEGLRLRLRVVGVGVRVEARHRPSTLAQRTDENESGPMSEPARR